MSKDQWLQDYERVEEDYIRDSERQGQEWAEKQARATLKHLGFDPPEINDHILAMRDEVTIDMDRQYQMEKRS